MDALTPDGPTDATRRQHWMSVLAKADGADLRKAWDDFPDKPDYRMLRPPETGLVMVRARAGGTGQPFNFGEMTVTRCVVELVGGMTGHSYVAGTDAGHAEIAAVFDGLLRHDLHHADVHAAVIDPLHRARPLRGSSFLPWCGGRADGRRRARPQQVVVGDRARIRRLRDAGPWGLSGSP